MFKIHINYIKICKNICENIFTTDESKYRYYQYYVVNNNIFYRFCGDVSSKSVTFTKRDI